jgi:CBS domain-containing protein
MEKSMTAKDIMDANFPVVSMKTPIKEAVRILRKNFGDESYLNAAPALIVTKDNGELAGILSPLTIIQAFLDSAQALQRPPLPGSSFYEEICFRIKDKLVEDVMDWQPISVTENALLLDVAELFAKNRFQRIPVVRNNIVIGVIYRSRLLFAMAKCML